MRFFLFLLATRLSENYLFFGGWGGNFSSFEVKTNEFLGVNSERVAFWAIRIYDVPCNISQSICINIQM